MNIAYLFWGNRRSISEMHRITGYFQSLVDYHKVFEEFKVADIVTGNDIELNFPTESDQIMEVIGRERRDIILIRAKVGNDSLAKQASNEVNRLFNLESKVYQTNTIGIA